MCIIAKLMRTSRNKVWSNTVLIYRCSTCYGNTTNCFFYGVGSSAGHGGGWRRRCVPIWTGIKGVCSASAEVNNSSSEVVGDAARGELGNDSKGFPLGCRPTRWISSMETNPPGPSTFSLNMRSFKRNYREGLYPVYPTMLSHLCLEPALTESLSRCTQKKLIERPTFTNSIG